MKTFFTSLLGGFVALFLFLILVPILLILIGLGIAAGSGSSEPAAKSIVLELDLREVMPDQPLNTGAGVFFAQPAFIDVLLKLDAAASDPKVKGVFVQADMMGPGSSRAEELRTAFLKLRESGKFVVAHSQGMMGVGPSSLRSVSAADEIWMQPATDMMVSGIAFETLFMKGLFENIDVEADIEALYEYKNAPNVYQETDYTPSHREAMTKLADDMWTISLEDIAADRGFASTDALRTLLESGPMSAAQAETAGLITGQKWPEDAREAARLKGGDSARVVMMADYSAPAAPTSAPLIAIIGGEGAIITGAGDTSPFATQASFASDRIAAEILKAGENETVKAIVFRVDSPGGSATASDQIWRAVERVREEHDKPVIVSMGSVAASGGYYVSAGADEILALRTTITGSIGVFGGKFAVAGGLNRLGITPQTISVGGDFASAWGTEAFTPEQKAKLGEGLVRTYDRFMEVVAEGRDMPETRVRELAKGRVWSGEAALERGLVNRSGGLIAAIAVAQENAGINADTRVRTRFYPEEEDPFEALGQIFGASADTARAAAVLGTVLGDERLNSALAQARGVQSGETQMSAPLIVEK